MTSHIKQVLNQCFRITNYSGASQMLLLKISSLVMVSNTQPVQTVVHRVLQYNPVSENITLMMSSVELLNVGSSVFFSLAHRWVSHDMLSTYIISVTYTVNLGPAIIPN